MKKYKKGGTIALLSVSSVLLVGALVVDVLMLSTFERSISKVFIDKSTDLYDKDDAFANALDVAEEIADEGEVLLENDGVLPLKNTTKINVLGVRSEDIVWGGSGSGGSAYKEPRVRLEDALKDEGFEPNPDLVAGYKELQSTSTGGFNAGFGNNERAATAELATAYNQEFFYTGNRSFESLASYSDTALIVLGRAGGEGNDLPLNLGEQVENTPDVDKDKHYLELNEAEKSLIEESKKAFKKVIVVINSSNAMELGFLQSDSPSPDSTGDIDAAIWIGGPGHVGTKSLAKILKGEVNPSGRLTDTYPYDVEATPALNNFPSRTYTNSSDCFPNYDNHPAYFINYQEGIYVGYRYYETADSFSYTTLDGQTRTNQSYDDTVQYPFGYGLSYTDFTYEVTASKADGSDIKEDDTLSFNITVTNDGDVAGKDVVELYYTPSYNSTSKIQKSDVNLIGFAKTPMIQPHASETVTIEVAVSDMASYDDLKYYTTTGSYVLESGDYNFSVRSDAHTVIQDFDYNLEETYVYQDEEAKKVEGVNYIGKRDSDEEVAINRFDDARGDFEFATRENGFHTDKAVDKEATAEQLEAFRTAMDLGDYEKDGDVAPEWGVTLPEKITLFDMQDIPYDDPSWDDFLSQLSLDDLDGFLATNGWGSAAVASIDKAQTYDMDGPSGISYVFDSFIGTVTYETVAYPAPVVLASTWNKDLATKFGDAISKEGQAWNVSGWYAPGANIHRTPFDGRNFEYYSEDPFISGVMMTNTVQAVQNNGMYAYMKHFVLNETETNRHYGLCTWVSEQSLREIYAKPFEMAVKDADATAMMSAYNNIGTTWAGASKALLQDMLRGEWGFVGTVLTDNLEDHGFMNIEKAILNGGTSLLCNGMFASQNINNLKQTATGQLALKEAAHQYLYTIANSFVPGMKIETAPWKIITISVSAVVYVIAALGYGWAIFRIVKNKRNSSPDDEQANA